MAETQSIFNPDADLERLNQTAKDTIVDHLGIRYTELGPDYLVGTMPSDARTIQPAGILHGGASVVLAESLGSVASYLVIDINKEMAVGLEVNANHLRPAPTGTSVTGTCRPIHLGKSTHVWDIRITNEAGKLTCICRLTMAVKPLPG